MSIALPVVGQVISKSTFGDPVVNALNAITDGVGVVTSGASTFSGSVTIGATVVTGAWTAYATNWTASAGTPAIGNGTLSATFRLVGKTVDVRIELTAGSTTTFGTAGAFWQFSLPSGHTVSGRFVGSLMSIDTGVLEYNGTSEIGYSSATTISLLKSSSGRMSNNSPFTFGNTDRLTVTIRYEIT